VGNLVLANQSFIQSKKQQGSNRRFKDVFSAVLPVFGLS